MTARFKPGRARGSIEAPPSKTHAHRLLIAAALSQSPSVVSGLCYSEDILATLDCIGSLGAAVDLSGSDARIRPGEGAVSSVFPCRESGSTLRFMIPLALLRDTESVFTGSGRLFARPLGAYETLCAEHGLLFERIPGGLRVKGPLGPGRFRIRGDVSSQFVTGLLFALPFLGGDSVLELIPPVVSVPYIRMTLDVLRSAGALIEETSPFVFSVPGKQELNVKDAKIEGDWSNAAFPLAFDLLGGAVKVGGLSSDSSQGDRACASVFPLFSEGAPTVRIGDTPDLAPVYMALGGALHGVTLLETGRLKLKESDRGEAMAEELAKFGIRCETEEDRITVFPSPLRRPSGPADSHNDHRIAMAVSLLLSLTGGELTGAEAVRKSWPEFYDALGTLGIEVELI